MTSIPEWKRWILYNLIGEGIHNVLFEDQIKKLDEYDLLFTIIKKFANPESKKNFKVDNPLEMGYIFEELIRKFAELSNETLVS